MNPEHPAAAVEMRAGGDSLAHIAKALGVGQSSVSGVLARVDDTDTIPAP